MAVDYILTGADGRYFPDQYWPKVYGYWPGYYHATGKIVSEADLPGRLAETDVDRLAEAGLIGRVTEAGATSRLAATSVARVARS